MSDKLVALYSAVKLSGKANGSRCGLANEFRRLHREDSASARALWKKCRDVANDPAMQIFWDMPLISSNARIVGHL